eukprot:TRINITY_DN50129_c0_g1_i1.p1 TRINITY_DN50129_c0_g1~~TRINITY_DN50129_c0_g1_i1.p1  ORF type:complete len:464 (-),score=134.87 TRINITY_DN50129_c0_g1_i1:48-1439(-)
MGEPPAAQPPTEPQERSSSPYGAETPASASEETAARGFEGASRGELKRALMRKVAQLTKVVVHLNTRNDEHELRVAKLLESGEEDVNKVLESASQSIVHEASRADVLSNGRLLTEKAAHLEGLFQQRRTDLLGDLSRLKQDFGSSQVHLMNEAGFKLQGLTQKLRETSQSLQSSLRAYKDIVLRSREDMEQRDAELRDGRAAQLKAVEADHERRLEDLQTALGREVDHLRQSWEQAVAHLRRTHESDMSALKMQAERKQHHQMQRLEQDFGEERRLREQGLSQLEFERQQAQRDLADFRASCTQVQQQVDSMRGTLEEMRRRAESARTDADLAQEEAASMEDETAALLSEIAVLQVRQQAAGIPAGAAAPLPPGSRVQAGAQRATSQVTGSGFAEELREAIANANHLEAELGQVDAEFGDIEDELAEGDKRVEILEVETEEERLRTHRLQSRILQLEASQRVA